MTTNRSWGKPSFPLYGNRNFFEAAAVLGEGGRKRKDLGPYRGERNYREFYPGRRSKKKGEIETSWRQKRAVVSLEKKAVAAPLTKAADLGAPGKDKKKGSSAT